MTTAIVLGATGLVGSELVNVLQVTPFYSSVQLLSRRPSGHAHPRISERIIDFDAPKLDGISGTHLYCALGTTLKKAGSKAVQFRIDCEYPTTIATQLKNQGVTRMILVSSVGADAHANNFYLRTKGQLEANLIALGFESTAIFRPSILLGRQTEFRFGEHAAMLLLNVLSPLMLGPLSKYRGIDARRVAERMVQVAQSDVRGVRYFEFDQIRAAP